MIRTDGGDDNVASWKKEKREEKGDGRQLCEIPRNDLSYFPSFQETTLTLSNLPSRLGDGNRDGLSILSLSTELKEVVDSALGPVPNDQRRPSLGVKGSGHVLFERRWNKRESAFSRLTVEDAYHCRLCIDPFISGLIRRRAEED